MDPATVERLKQEDEPKEPRPEDFQGVPPINQVINIDDFEVYYLSEGTYSRKFHSAMHPPVLGPTIPLPLTTNSVSGLSLSADVSPCR